MSSSSSLASSMKHCDFMGSALIFPSRTHACNCLKCGAPVDHWRNGFAWQLNGEDRRRTSAHLWWYSNQILRISQRIPIVDCCAADACADLICVRCRCRRRRRKHCDPQLIISMRFVLCSPYMYECYAIYNRITFTLCANALLPQMRQHITQRQHSSAVPATNRWATRGT